MRSSDTRRLRQTALDRVSVLHAEIQDAPSAADSPVGDWLEWRTCARILRIGFHGAPIEVAGWDSSHGARALCQLVEIVSGMHSPHLGETEIQSQFRKFLDQYPRLDSLQSVGRVVLSEAASVRDRFFRGLGGQSYGSCLRKKLRGVDSVALIGRGLLSQSLLPWLEGKKVSVVSPRSLDRGDPPGAVVVAAPVESERLRAAEWLWRTCEIVVDFREASERGRGWDRPAVVLEEIHAAIRNTTAEAEAARDTARAFIAARVARIYGPVS